MTENNVDGPLEMDKMDSDQALANDKSLYSEDTDPDSSVLDADVVAASLDDGGDPEPAGLEEAIDKDGE